MEKGNNLVCSECIQDSVLSNIINENGQQSQCFYCGQTLEKSTPLINLIKIIGETILKLFMPVDDDDYEYHYKYKRLLHELIFEEAQIDENLDNADQLVEDIIELLLDEFYSHAMAKDGEPPPFYLESSYCLNPYIDGCDWLSRWHEFEDKIKTQVRYFNPATDPVLSGNNALGDFFSEFLKAVLAKCGLIKKAGPGTDLAKLYRAREFFNSTHDLMNAMCRPELELGPPPKEKATSGRMNATGISVFYSATNPNLALHEIRPVPHSKVLVAEFEIIKELNLLDLSRPNEIFEFTSIFAPDYPKLHSQTKFMKRLCDLISRPVMPTDRDFDYIPTQAFSDYISSINSPEIDGIIFRSTLSQEPGVNVVLFHKSCKVMIDPLADEYTYHAELRQVYPDGGEMDYFVAENEDKNRISLSNGTQNQPHKSIPKSLIYPYGPSINYDKRPPTLKVLKDTLKVNEIDEVKISSKSFSVTRHSGIFGYTALDGDASF